MKDHATQHLSKQASLKKIILLYFRHASMYKTGHISYDYWLSRTCRDIYIYVCVAMKRTFIDGHIRTEAWVSLALSRLFTELLI